MKRFHALLGAAALATLCLAACARVGTEATATVATPLSTASTPSPTTSDGSGVPTPLTAASTPSPTTSDGNGAPTPLTAASTPSPTASDGNGAPTPTSAPRSAQGRGGGFVPLDDPAFISASAATFLADDELVLGYEQDEEARAYPVSMMFWHHIINDTVQGGPLLVTY